VIRGSSRQPVSSGRLVRPLEPDPPAWVHDLLRGARRQTDHSCGAPIEILWRDRFVRLTTCLPEATCLAADELSRLVAERYAAMERRLAELKRHAIRIWNYIPGIADTMETGLDRYMAFNRGRYTAYNQLIGDDARFARELPAASAIGVIGRDLVIDCLASACRGQPVANPRQSASWHYSRRYGPMPPCFARGTVASINGRAVLIVAGTASIVGEESRHHGDVRAQVTETLANIEALVLNAAGPASNPLHRLTNARIYIVNEADRDEVEEMVRGRTTRAMRLETVLARVCRPELLVEIEAIADLGADGH
jgi:enamine deaminase RidA (YjgF/YER057c/UK114 family)